MKDIISNARLAETHDSDNAPFVDWPEGAVDATSRETEVQFPARVDEKADVPPEMMQAEPPHGEAEQTEVERSSATGPFMTQADAPADVSAEAAAEPAPLEPNKAPWDGLDAQVAWDAGLAAESAIVHSEPLEPESEARDLSDTVAPDTEDTAITTIAETAPQPIQDGDASEQDPMLAIKKGKAELAIDLMNGKASFFYTLEGDTFAEIQRGDHIEVWSTRSKEFELLLRHFYWRETQTVLKKADLETAILQAEAMAMFDGTMKKVGLRVTKHGNAIYIDLCNPEWQQIEITPNGWRVIEMETSPVRFRRTKGMLALPHPERGGDLNNLRGLLNLDNDSNFIPVVSYLIGAMNPSGPFPILIIQGEQGSGKSTLTNCIRNLLDPSSVPSRTLPRTERDLIISAEASLLLCYDNVSGIKDAMSDAFCRIATGGGFGTRTLYRNRSQELFHSTRPTLFNGISDLVVKHDFADRALVVTLPPINAENRRPMSEIKGEWQALRPQALGALCNAAVEALRDFDHVHLDRSPRMADFAKWVSAAEPALPWERGRFIAEYEKNRFELIEIAIESDPISLSIMEMMKQLGKKEWIGTPTDLLKTLAVYVPNNGARKKDWPQAPNIFTNRLRRVQTTLRAKGIDVDHSKSGNRSITLKMRSQGAQG